MSTIETDDEPVFAPNLHSILDRYRHAAVDRVNAVNALTSITLALAPEDLFGEDGEDQLNAYFELQVDRYRMADGHADAVRDEVVAFVWSAAQGHIEARHRLDGASRLGL